MRAFRCFGLVRTIVGICVFAAFAIGAAAAQQLDAVSVIQRVDAAVRTRFDHVTGFTDREHYAVFRGKDQVHPAAEMTVEVTYQKDSGKSYKVLTTSGSALIRKFGLMPLLEREKDINQPGQVEHSWFTSANYTMQLKPGGIQRVNGHDCIALAITPLHKATNMIQGTLWVDAKDYSIVQVEGVASQSPSIWAGTTHMTRRYASVSGFAMATHARAESSSFLAGRTVVIVDYSDYRLQILPVR